MKTHKKIEITAKMLADRAACNDGIQLFKKLGRRVVISTDPSENAKLAFKLQQLQASELQASELAYAHVSWLLRRCDTHIDDQRLLPRVGDQDDPLLYSYDDPMFYQQALAVIADRMLTAQGK